MDDPSDEYTEKAQQFLHDFTDFLLENFGERCENYDEGCACCKIWVLYDQVYEIVNV